MTIRQLKLKKELEQTKIQFNRHARKSHELYVRAKAKQSFGHTAKLLRKRAREEEEMAKLLKSKINNLAFQIRDAGVIPEIV